MKTLLILITVVATPTWALTKAHMCELEKARQPDIETALKSYKENCAHYPSKLVDLFRNQQKCKVTLQDKPEMRAIMMGYTYDSEFGKISPRDCTP
jgi:hypothetical protein